MKIETNEHGNLSLETPENLGKLTVGEIYDTAAGMIAVYESSKDAMMKAGAVEGANLLLHLNQKNGIDCNSCAWADPDEHRTIAEFCESGAKAVADEATTLRVTPEFFARFSVEELSKQSDQWLNAQGRITQPLILRENATHYEAISWDESFQIIAEKLNALASPDQAVFYTSGRTSNETAYLYQLLRGNSGRIICPTARICVTNQRVSRSPNQSVWAKRRFGSKIWKTRI